MHKYMATKLSIEAFLQIGKDPVKIQGHSECKTMMEYLNKLPHINIMNIIQTFKML